jgi:MoaA/NifB/PqqE/SkfB family radical SAM enzyme
MSEININTQKFKDPLALIEFQATSACNMKCFFCGDSITNPENLTLDLVKKVVDEVNPVGISFTGGEPLLNPNLLEIVRWCSKQAITQINTNSVLLTEEKAKEFEAAGLNLWHFSRHYSVGCRARIYQGIKIDTYNEIGKTIENTIKRHAADVNIETTLNITNLYDLFEIHDWAYNIGAEVHEVVPVMMSGRSKSNRFTVPLSMLYKTLTRFLENKHDMFVKIGCLPITECSPYGDIWKYHGHNKINFAMCKEGSERLHIHNDGSIIICDQTYPLSETPIGNAKTDSVWDIFYNNPIINRWREKPAVCDTKCYGVDCRNTCQGSVFDPEKGHLGKGWEKFV